MPCWMVTKLPVWCSHQRRQYRARDQPLGVDVYETDSVHRIFGLLVPDAIVPRIHREPRRRTGQREVGRSHLLRGVVVRPASAVVRGVAKRLHVPVAPDDEVPVENDRPVVVLAEREPDEGLGAARRVETLLEVRVVPGLTRQLIETARERDQLCSAQPLVDVLEVVEGHQDVDLAELCVGHHGFRHRGYSSSSSPVSSSSSSSSAGHFFLCFRFLESALPPPPSSSCLAWYAL